MNIYKGSNSVIICCANFPVGVKPVRTNVPKISFLELTSSSGEGKTN